MRNRLFQDQDNNEEIFKIALDKTKKLNNDQIKNIHEEKLNIVNNTKNLLKSKNKLLNLSREININDEEYNFRNKVSNILGVIIIFGIVIALIVLSAYLVSNSNQALTKMRTIFG